MLFWVCLFWVVGIKKFFSFSLNANGKTEISNRFLTPSKDLTLAASPSEEKQDAYVSVCGDTHCPPNMHYLLQASGGLSDVCPWVTFCAQKRQQVTRRYHRHNETAAAVDRKVLILVSHSFGLKPTNSDFLALAFPCQAKRFFDSQAAPTTRDPSRSHLNPKALPLESDCLSGIGLVSHPTPSSEQTALLNASGIELSCVPFSSVHGPWILLLGWCIERSPAHLKP